MNGVPLTRRAFLAGSGAWLGASAAGFSALNGKTRTISLFHTTDLHGHILPTRTYGGIDNVGGFARCASLIRKWRIEAPHSLLVDIGDVYQGTPASLASEGKLMIRLFNLLGYDAWTLGNHDFDWGPEALEENLALSKSPILTGNIQVAGKSPGTLDGAWKSVLPWMLKEVGGFRIALIGLVTPGLPYWLAQETLGDVVARHPLESLKRSVAQAKSAQADAIVVMAHMGWRIDDDFANPVQEILKLVPGVDVMLAGHTHQDKESWKHGDVLCTQAAYHGIKCGRVDLTFDTGTRRLVDRAAHSVFMDQSHELDPAVIELADPDLKKSAEQLARKVATVIQTIPGTGRDNALSRLFCELFAKALERNQTPVDGVFHGTFGTGDLRPGELTVADCWNLLPYENLLLTVEISAEELIEIVRSEGSNRKSDRILWGFDLRFDGEGKVTAFEHKGKPVPTGSRFTIAFNSYDAQSGGQSMMRLREITTHPGAKRTITAIDTRSALISGLLDRQTIP
jgi:2',3'-cyclic-nucleotide 2'-phosphodiesterase (5'-nucleotidase family)